MTDTAAMADIVLPATMFLEHDDIYQGGGHQHIMLGPKLIEPPGECRTNHQVFAGAGRAARRRPSRLRDERARAYRLDARQSGRGTLAELEAKRWIDCQPDFERAHYLDGFGHPDRQVPLQARLAAASRRRTTAPMGPWADAARVSRLLGGDRGGGRRHPFRLATSPARNFLNSSFTETPTSRAKEGGGPRCSIHPEDARGARHRRRRAVRLGNGRGAVMLHARHVRRASRAACSSPRAIWPNAAFADGNGINTLTGADPAAPFGGAAFHDNRVLDRGRDRRRHRSASSRRQASQRAQVAALVPSAISTRSPTTRRRAALRPAPARAGRAGARRRAPARRAPPAYRPAAPAPPPAR